MYRGRITVVNGRSLRWEKREGAFDEGGTDLNRKMDDRKGKEVENNL